MVGCGTFSAEEIVRFGRIFSDLLNTSFPNTSPSPAKVQIVIIFFVPE
jgi:hypothetical protein